MIQIQNISPKRDDVAELIKLSHDYMGQLYPKESTHLDDPDKLSRPNVYFLGVFDDEKLVGMGAVKKLKDDVSYGEIKRVFVLPEYRGRGFSKKLMDELEGHLIEENISICRLETGVRQPEALSLYEKRGYIQREPYSAYQPDPLSVFMEKKLV